MTSRNKNVLIILDSTIHFDGFPEITSDISFMLYPSGIVIKTEKTAPAPNHYNVSLDENRNVQDKKLIAILLGRQYKQTEEFIYNNGAYYECDLHPIQ